MPLSSRSILAGLTMLGGVIAAQAQPVELISTPENVEFYAGQGNLNSGNFFGCDMSVDGERTAFTSDAFNLIVDDNNASSDVLVFDSNTSSLNAASINSAGEQANGLSQNESISGDGRYVLFGSEASNLGVTQTRQVFRHDLLTGETLLVGIGPDGNEFDSVFPQDLSADGNLAVFTANDDSQAWMRNITEGESVLLSQGIGGEPANSFIRDVEISGSGEFVVFESDSDNLVADDGNGTRDIFIHNLIAGTIERIDSLADDDPNDQSVTPTISANGRWVAFSSSANNLIASDTEGQQDVFLYDRLTDTTVRISEEENGVGGNAASSAPRISPDGRFVLFESAASNFVVETRGMNVIRNLFLYDRDEASLQQVAADAFAPQTGCVTSDTTQVLIAYTTGSHPLIPANLERLQLVSETVSLDPLRRTTARRGDVRVISSVDPAIPVTIGSESSSNPAPSANGRYVAFVSRAENVLGIAAPGSQLVRLDLENNERVLLSQANPAFIQFFDGGASPTNVSISGNGNRVAFVSASSLLVDDDENALSDVFVRNVPAGITRRVSVASDGSQANGFSTAARISADGDSVVFESSADNLVASDSNGSIDVFVHRLSSGLTERASVSTQGLAKASSRPDINLDGRYVVFQSSGNLLDDGGADFTSTQIWLRDLQEGTTELISTDAAALPGDGNSSFPRISATGRWILFRSSAVLDPAFPTLPDDALYLYDRQTGNNRLISLDEEDLPVPISRGGAQLAADGSAVLFQRAVKSGEKNQDQDQNALGSSPDGRLYLRSINQQRTLVIDPQTTDGLPPDATLDPMAIDADGESIYVVSAASNLVPQMINGEQDIYRIELDLRPDLILRDRFEAPAP